MHTPRGLGSVSGLAVEHKQLHSLHNMLPLFDAQGARMAFLTILLDILCTFCIVQMQPRSAI